MNWKKEAVKSVAQMMAAAAITAPKARGINNLVVEIYDGKKLASLAASMREKAPECWSFFHRDADNVENSSAVLIIGTKVEPIELNCGLCGYPSCKESLGAHAVCAYNTGDLGIAVGSAVSVAAHHHIDNRVMFSAGWTAVQLGLLGKSVKIAYAIPLSVSGKNIFFDRE